ncbi:MAG: endo alpha-1,4 polygalactosaminidase [Kofleriaceae bacterium]
MRFFLLLVCLAACGSGTGMGSGDDAPGDDAGSGGDGGTSDGANGDGNNSMVALPPVNAKVDYQLGGPYTPPVGVTVVSRDRTAPPAVGLYNICYVNGFQIQPDEESMWMQQHPDLILRDNNGPVIDPDWDEMLIDVSTSVKRDAVAVIVGGWIDGCRAAGFQAIEIDNLDSYTRSRGLLNEASAVAAMKLFSDRAHAAGMAIAQKNSAEIVSRKAELGTDFAVTEECNTYDECDVYTGGYGDHVIVIEYVRADFNQGCTAFPNLSIVLRDRNLVLPSSGAYVYDDC